MNDKIQIPLHLGVDRHNRVPQPNGPMLRSTRNLVLDDQNELVRRKSMEYKQDVAVLSATSGGAFAAAGGATQVSLPTSASNPKQPLCLWLPRYGGTPAHYQTALGRALAVVFRGSAQDLLLGIDGISIARRMPAHPRRPQAVDWRGGLWIACGDAVPDPLISAYTTANPATGLIHVVKYVDALGVMQTQVFSGMGVQISGSGYGALLTDATLSDACAAFRPRVIGTYRDRLVMANFPDAAYGGQRRNGILFSDSLSGSRTNPWNSTIAPLLPGHGTYDIPIFGSDGVDPMTTRLFLVGEDGEEIIGCKEISLQQSGAMNQSAYLILKDRSTWLMTGEPLTTDELGTVAGDAAFIKQPIEDGCASNETICETPWGIIWAGHEDVYFMPNGGGAPTPIGRRIAKQLLNTPFNLKYLWHASYHDGYYRLAIMAPGQRQEDPVAMEEEWRLDLRYGPPADWTQARWFGPQVFQPIASPNGEADDIYRGTFIQAVEKRAGFKKELFALQIGAGPSLDNYGFVLCGLDGEDTKDWSCLFSSTTYRAAATQESLSLNEKRVVSEADWLYGRQKMVTVAGTSQLSEPDWTDNYTPVTDGGVTWQSDGKVAVPGNFNSLVVNDGEDALPTSRGNEVLGFIRSMELPANMLGRDVMFRGLEVGASARDCTTWALQGIRDGLHEGSLLDTQGTVSNFILGLTALDARVNDPIAPFAVWLDGKQNYDGLVVGKHVGFALGEYPYFTIGEDQLAFSFYFDENNDNSPELLVGATLDTSLTGLGFPNLASLLDVVVAAMNTALTAASLPGTFSHNLTTAPSTCPVKPTLTHSTREWTPNCYNSSFYESINGDNPSLWLQLGFDPLGPGVLDSNFTNVHTAPNSPWQRKVPKLRISSLVAVLRSFKRGPT